MKISSIQRDLKETYQEGDTVKLTFEVVFEPGCMELFRSETTGSLRIAVDIQTIVDRMPGNKDADHAGRVYEIQLKKPADRLRSQSEFLDIRVPRAGGSGVTGKHGEIPFEVTFVTGHDKHVHKEVKSGALHHISKPVETAEPAPDLKKVAEHVRPKRNNRPQIVSLPNHPGHGQNGHKIAVHQADSVKFIDAKNIAYIEADGGYCRITTCHEEQYMLSKYLKDFEDYFGENSLFVRIGKSVLLNTQYITQYTKGEFCIIQMCDGRDFDVSRRKKNEVLQKLKQAVPCRMKNDLPVTGGKAVMGWG